jgi:GT2 family glycosyltransferase
MNLFCQHVEINRSLRTMNASMAQIGIVIPVLNQLRYTQQCLADLQPDIDRGVRVVVVNNASTDGSHQWLSAQSNIQIIHNQENKGCASAWNQGCAALQESDWIVVLNNDVRLPLGWLDQLVDAADRLGLDIISPAMCEMELNYVFEEHAAKIMKAMRSVLRRGVAHGVCFMVRKSVFDRIGGFDEAFRIGQFEDSDFFLRAQKAGFRLGVTGASFIHHFGSITQRELKKDGTVRPYEAENRAYFRQKWKQGWIQRRCEKSKSSFRSGYWSLRERFAHGHSLIEKIQEGVVRYF